MRESTTAVMAAEETDFKMYKVIPVSFLEETVAMPKVQVLENLSKLKDDVQVILSSRLKPEDKVSELLKLVGVESGDVPKESRTDVPQESRTDDAEGKKVLPLAPFPAEPPSEPSAKKWKHLDRCAALMKENLL